MAGLAGGLFAGIVAETMSGVVWQLGPLRLNNYMLLLATSVAVRLLDLLLIVPRLDDPGATGTLHVCRMMAGDVVVGIRRCFGRASVGSRDAV